MDVHCHHDNCIFILVDEEMYGEERINNEMETTQRKDKIGEDRENEVDRV